MSVLADTLRAAFGADRVTEDEPLAPFTTFRVGGPADVLMTVRTAAEIERAVAIARACAQPITALGGGSNVLVADGGVRGLVLRIHGGDVVQIDQRTVRADAGVTINGLVRWTISRGLAGVEAWAGTPGTVGGAIYGNAHFQGRLVSELVSSVELLSPDGETRRVPAEEMEFAYDYSRLHQTREIVLAVDFRVSAGHAAELREVARASLAFRKRTQPLEKASAGCIFQNPDPAVDRLPDGVPYSAGALVDRAGLKDAACGRARVSIRHANFIVHDGAATAAEIADLVEHCRRAVKERFGVELKDEIVRLGVVEPRSGRAEPRQV
jgi:UDP-N-acetylmuramate dehydrogenase